MPDSDFFGIDAQFSDYNPNANTMIEQADTALHPKGKNLLELIMKTRIDPNLKPLIDHIVSRAIRRGKLDMIFGDGRLMNAGEALFFADALTSYAINGRSREELIEMVGNTPFFNRHPKSKGSYEQEMTQ